MRMWVSQLAWHRTPLHPTPEFDLVLGQQCGRESVRVGKGQT